jgi:4-oxalocrotonate tautomerase
MPIVSVSLLEGRPPEKLEALIADLTDTVAGTLCVPASSVRVILSEVPPSHWGVGGVSKLQQRQQETNS